MSIKVMTFGPPRRFCRILISRLIFFFFTGWKRRAKVSTQLVVVVVVLTLRILMTTFSWLVVFIPSNTSLYFPRPSLRTI